MSVKSFRKQCRKIGWDVHVITSPKIIIMGTCEDVTISVQEGDFRKLYHAQLRFLALAANTTLQLIESQEGEITREPSTGAYPTRAEYEADDGFDPVL